MQRFFVDKSVINADTITISGDDATHISRVLRLGAGDEIVVCDGLFTDYFCEIESVSKSEVSLHIKHTEKNNNEPPVEITLYQSIPKSDKMDYIIQKSVELGVSKVVPVLTKHCVVKIKDGEKKVLRWRKIAAEAAKQCGRGKIPEVSEVMNFEDAVKSADGLKIIPYENEKNNKLKNILKDKDIKKTAVFIGPEGGFDEGEILLAKKCGANSVTLGPRILRTETAPIAVVSVCMYELGDW